MSIINRWIQISRRAEKILVTSTQYPFYGGAATNAYALIKFFRERGYRAAGIFFTQGIENANIDPDNIGGIIECRPVNVHTMNRAKNFIIKYLNGNPNIIYSKNYYAPVVSKKMFGRSVIMAYLVAGCPQMSVAAKHKVSAIKYISTIGTPIHHRMEHSCIHTSDIIIPNSALAQRLLLKNYGRLQKITNPIDTSLAMNIEKIEHIPFEERKYDICFSSSHLNRAVKNPEMALRLMKHPRFEKCNKVVIGYDAAKFETIKNTHVAGFMGDNKEVIDIMNNSKVVICPSYYDASPNVIKEAIICGCNFLVSKNCGWSERYPEEFVCDDVYDANQWNKKLSYLIDNKVDYSHEVNQDDLLKGLYLR